MVDIVDFKNIKIKLKYKYVEKEYKEFITKAFEYPIQAFLNGEGNWSYTDVDSLCNYNYCSKCKSRHADEEDAYLYCNYDAINYFCQNNGESCVIPDPKPYNKDYKPSFDPKDLLNINNWLKFYFVQEGERDQEEWIIVVKHVGGVYIYFRAGCDFTGFDCQGGGQISFSYDKKLFWNFCLDSLGRTLVLKENGVNLKIDFNDKYD